MELFDEDPKSWVMMLDENLPAIVRTDSAVTIESHMKQYVPGSEKSDVCLIRRHRNVNQRGRGAMVRGPVSETRTNYFVKPKLA